MTPADIVAEVDLDDRLADAEQAVARENLTLESAQTKLEVLRKYTADRTKGELAADIERKRMVELSHRATLELEKDRTAKLERQIQRCVLLAPAEGAVVYANDPGRGPVSNRVQIEEGATVRERQKIVSIIDLNAPARVNVKVHESLVARVRPSQKARIKVDAFSGLTLTGSVSLVAPLPDPQTSFEGSKKLYTALVRIDDGPKGLRPGLSAEVEIPIADLDDVLIVPVAAVLHLDGKDQLAVKTPGGFAWREVTLGGPTAPRSRSRRGSRPAIP